MTREFPAVQQPDAESVAFGLCGDGFIENAPIGIFRATVDKLIFANRALALMFGYESPSEMIAICPNPSEYFSRGDQHANLIGEAVASKNYVNREALMNRKDGTTFSALIRMRAARDESGGLEHLEGFVEDISEQKRAEQRFLDSERKFRQLADNISKVFWICDLGSRDMIFVSPAYEQIWGRSCESLYQCPQSFADAIHPDDKTRFLDARQKGMRGDGFEEEYRVVRPDGALRWVRDRGFIVRNDQGERYRMAGFAEDITERRELEMQLRQAQKMEAVALLAGGVAHDFNNILSATLMHLGILLQSSHVTVDTKESLREVEKETKRAASLTRQLLLFGRRQEAVINSLDMDEVVAGLLDLLRRLLGEKIAIEFLSCPKHAWVRADLGMMEQVIMNLCVNARDAMTEGGRLTLSNRQIIFDEKSLKANHERRAGRFVCLKVEDTGCGMDESVLKRVFEPFFTTKDVGKGTGLGLATVYGIVKQHEGWVEVESKVGKGSSFSVYLPETQPAPSAIVSDRPEPVAGGSETILLVEDETAVRRVTALFLRKLGYAVLEAGSGPEALKQWTANKDRIAMLFSDMVMPDSMSGLELAERLMEEKRNLQVVICSGYSEELERTSRLSARNIIFLPKPYGSTALAMLVRSCLNKK